MNLESQRPARADLLEAGRYPDWQQANERALVILSMGIGYWLFREDDEFVLCVQEQHREAAAAELAKFEEDVAAPARRVRPSWPQEKASTISLFVFGWVMAVFFLLQLGGPAWWEDRGVASADKILHTGEWWRTITALTLHADFAHFGANLTVGLVFATFVLPAARHRLELAAHRPLRRAGNLLNAWGYRDQGHVSLGASTAVFGALGILVGCQVATLFALHRRPRRRDVLVPIGAGLALLAFLGTGGEHSRVDYMAHFWGFLAGNVLGALAMLLRLRTRTPRAVQWVLSAATLALLAGPGSRPRRSRSRIQRTRLERADRTPDSLSLRDSAWCGQDEYAETQRGGAATKS